MINIEEGGVFMSLKRGIVELVDYDENWQEEYKKEEKLLKDVLGEKIKEIHHIGSNINSRIKSKTYYRYFSCNK